MDDATPTAYDDLLDRVGRIANVSHAGDLLSWDQQVMMPEEGTPARSRQLSALSAVQHDLLTADELGALLDELAAADLPDEPRAVVREVRRDHERAVRVPTDLVERISAASSEALTAWRDAKEEDDFERFAPHLEELLDLKRRYAEHVDPDRDPYAVLFEEYEPCLPLEHAESVLTSLREAVVPLVDDIRASEADLATDAFAGTFDADRQEALMRDALDDLGYPWERGRLDVAPHPFSTGTTYDARITTRYDEHDPMGALLSTIHEFGHATYTLGLPDDAYGTPLGEARDLSIHESQSRLWENHVGRSAAFWEGFLPRVREGLGIDGVSAREAYEAVNAVDPTNRIRVEADELTYHLHIVLRFEIERDLVRGDLDVAEVPAVWNDRMESYLGVRPETDAEGCLQDVHWSHGSFGYFPTYSLGSVIAAQLFDAADRDVDGLEDAIRRGEFGPLHDWLTDRVHRHGKRFETNELVRRATGDDVSADAFVDYATAKYGALYDIGG
jgi:carboxypeptidase Taq